MRANQKHLEAEKEDTAAQLRQAIDKTVSTLGSVEMTKVAALHSNEALMAKQLPASLAAMSELRDMGVVPKIQEVLAQGPGLMAYLQELLDSGPLDAAALHHRVKADRVVSQFAMSAPADGIAGLKLFGKLTPDQVKELATIVLQFRQLKMPVLGYLLRGGAVRALEQQLNQMEVMRPLLLKAEAQQLEQAAGAGATLRQALENAGIADQFGHCHQRLSQGVPDAQATTAALKACELLMAIPGVMDEVMATKRADCWTLALSYLRDSVQMHKAFSDAPQFDYVATKSKLERLNTSMMNAHVDDRLVSFMEDHRADARTLAQLIAQRQKFPEEKFEAVKKSFPIIIASIREFGECRRRFNIEPLCRLNIEPGVEADVEIVGCG